MNKRVKIIIGNIVLFSAGAILGVGGIFIGVIMAVAYAFLIKRIEKGK